MGHELLEEDQTQEYIKVNEKMVPEHLKKLLGRPIKIIAGSWKGYTGNLKTIQDRKVRVELSGKNKIVHVWLNEIADHDKDIINDIATPKTAWGGSSAKTPAYYPQSPGLMAQSVTSPKWNPTTRKYYIIVELIIKDGVIFMCYLL